MKDKEFVIEQKLRDIYYDPGTGFQSAERLYQKAKDDALSVSCRIVKEWLKTQDNHFLQFSTYKLFVFSSKQVYVSWFSP